MPEFAKIEYILLLGVDHVCVLVCKSYVTNCFHSHFHSYEVALSSEVIVVKQTELSDCHVLSKYTLRMHPNVFFVPMKYHVLENIV